MAAALEQDPMRDSVVQKFLFLHWDANLNLI